MLVLDDRVVEGGQHAVRGDRDGVLVGLADGRSRRRDLRKVIIEGEKTERDRGGGGGAESARV